MDSLTIPDKAGVILLPDAVLFPHGALPLHIFEPRYRQMLEEAIEGECMFCVGNLLGDDSTDPERCAAPVGTVGLIRASRESEEGTSNLLLHGVIRVYFESWHTDEKPYPYASIRPVIDTTLPVAEEKDYLARLRKAMNRALSDSPRKSAPSSTTPSTAPETPQPARMPLPSNSSTTPTTANAFSKPLKSEKDSIF